MNSVDRDESPFSEDPGVDSKVVKKHGALELPTDDVT